MGGRRRIRSQANPPELVATLIAVSYTWDEIEQDWLGALANLALSNEVVVAAFNGVERTFGRDWMETTRTLSGGRSTGVGPVLGVVSTGQWLESLHGIEDTGRLLEGLRSHDRAARTEAIAIHLLRSNDPRLEVELEPTVEVAGRDRVPDFRARKDGSAWTYVEVSAAELSEEGKAVMAALHNLARVIEEASVPILALEFFLRRTPTDEEQEELIALGVATAGRSGRLEEELPHELGKIRLNLDEPGKFTADLPRGEQSGPRLGALHRKLGPEVDRHVAVRIAFSDDRAAEFLRREAKHLPTDSPGLIVLFTDRGGWSEWGTAIGARLHPGQHTRVSGVCLVRSGLSLTENGEAWVPETRLIENKNAPHELPEWISEALSAFPSETA